MKNALKTKGIIGWVVVALLSVKNLILSASALDISVGWGGINIDLGWGGGWTNYASEPFYNEMRGAGAPTSDAGILLSQTNQRASLLERLLDVFGINYAGDGKALSYIQIIINYVLSFTAFVSLIVIIYGFYMMFFREQDKGFGQAKKTVTGAAIALFVIGISWLFVNFAFYVFNQGF